MDIGSYQGEFISFPSGIRLIAINDDQETVTVNFSKELDKSAESVTERALLRPYASSRGSRIKGPLNKDIDDVNVFLDCPVEAKELKLPE